MAWLFSFVLMAIQKGQDSPPPGRQLQAVPPPHLALLPLHRRHLAHHLRQLEQHWLLLPLCHPQLPLAQAQAGGPQLHRHLPRAAAGEFGHQVDFLSKRQDQPQLACWISGFFFWFFALYLVYAIIVYHKLLWYFIVILFPMLSEFSYTIYFVIIFYLKNPSWKSSFPSFFLTLCFFLFSDLTLMNCHLQFDYQTLPIADQCKNK